MEFQTADNKDNQTKFLYLQQVIWLHNLLIFPFSIHNVFRFITLRIQKLINSYFQMYSFRAQQGALVQRYKGQEIWLFYRLNFASLFPQTVELNLNLLVRSLKIRRWRRQHLGRILDGSLTWGCVKQHSILTLTFRLLIFRLSLCSLLIFAITAKPYLPLVCTLGLTSICKFSSFL